MEYLYYTPGFSTSVYREEISRESDTHIWIKYSDREIKISKKSMYLGRGYERTHYYKETPEYLEKYKMTVLKRQYEKQLALLAKCTDKEIMIQVINIKMPEVNENA